MSEAPGVMTEKRGAVGAAAASDGLGAACVAKAMMRRRCGVA